MTSWFTSALQTVREKSIDALDFVRRDLNEFTTTVKNDTEVYLNKIKTQEGDGLGINRFVSKFSDSSKVDNENEKHFQASASFDRAQKELIRLQNDESTYLNDPTPFETYENWRQTTDFNVDTRKGDIAQLLIDAPHVRSFYAQLVPAQTTHSDFWSRYYFRIHQIEEEEARRTQLLRRAHEMCSNTDENAGKNNENDWDELDEDGAQEPPKTTEESPSEPVPVEHHEEESPSEPIPVEHHEEESPSEPIPVEHHEEESSVITDTNSDQLNSERTESDTGDSWEREFDENDVVTSKPNPDPLTRSEETITSESLSTSTTTPIVSSSTTEKRPPNEFDDEWESWA
jgi:hypothetical protein